MNQHLIEFSRLILELSTNNIQHRISIDKLTLKIRLYVDSSKTSLSNLEIMAEYRVTLNYEKDSKCSLVCK